jgi:hypothetical protein
MTPAPRQDLPRPSLHDDHDDDDESSLVKPRASLRDLATLSVALGLYPFRRLENFVCEM